METLPILLNLHISLGAEFALLLRRKQGMVGAKGMVIPPFLAGRIGRIHAAIFSFCAGVMPPMPMLGRSLL